MKNWGITDCELVIMNALWDENRDLTLMEVCSIVTERYQKEWKVQTVSTFLKRLAAKGMLSYYRISRQYFYHPEISKNDCFEEYVATYTDMWKNTPVDYVAALNAKGKISKDDIAELKALIEKIED